MASSISLVQKEREYERKLLRYVEKKEEADARREKVISWNLLRFKDGIVFDRKTEVVAFSR